MVSSVKKGREGEIGKERQGRGEEEEGLKRWK